MQSSLSNANAYLTWFVATFFAFFQFFLQTASSVIGPEWMQDFHLNKVGLSNLSAAFFYTYALMQIPAGILFDRYQPRYILAISAFILAIGCFLLAYTEHYSIALFARLLMGLGSSCGFVGLLQVCATRFPPKRFAFMIGSAEGLAMFSVTFSVMLLGWLIAHYSWRTLIYGSSFITLILSLAVLVLVPNRVDERFVTHEKESLSPSIIAARLKMIFTNRQVILGSLFGFFIFSIINAFTSLWGVTFLLNTTGFSRQEAANMVSMVFIGIAIGGPLCGWLSKVLNQDRLLLKIGSAAATLIMSLIVFLPHLSKSFYFVLFLLIGLVCSVYIQCFALIKNAVHPVIRATALATTNMILMLSAPVLQLIIGWLLQTHFFGLVENSALVYRFSLGVLPLGMFIAFLISWHMAAEGD